MHPEPRLFAAPRRIAWLGLGGSLGFVGLGVWLALAPGMPAKARWTGLGNVLFFGLCAWGYGAEARRPRVALTLDATGLEHRHPDPRQAFRLAWSALAGVRVENEERASRVVLTFREPEGLPRASAPDWARAKGAWPPLVPIETTLSPAALGTTAPELADAIRRFWRYYAPATAPGAGVPHPSFEPP